MVNPKAAVTNAARVALLLITTGAAGLIWVCASPGGHEHYAKTHAAPSLDGQPLRVEVYASPARR